MAIDGQSIAIKGKFQVSRWPEYFTRTKCHSLPHFTYSAGQSKSTSLIAGKREFSE
jgi:hypothetical protein